MKYDSIMLCSRSLQKSSMYCKCRQTLISLKDHDISLDLQLVPLTIFSTVPRTVTNFYTLNEQNDFFFN